LSSTITVREGAGADVVLQVQETQIDLHLQFREDNVEPVETGKRVTHEQKRQQER